MKGFAVTPLFADASQPALPLHIVTADALASWLGSQTDSTRAWVTASGFTGALGKALLVPGADGKPIMALGGFGTAKARARSRFHLAGIMAALPAGNYEIASGLPDEAATEESLGALLAQYVFDRYRGQSGAMARLVAPKGVDADRVLAIAAGECLTRDLINTPTSDMGPDNLETAARDLAANHGAQIAVVVGDDLLAQNFPMIHAVGRASNTAPRLIDMSWGTSGPALTLVGKGVCFDTGGLNIKPSSSMGLMKKDMGGAAAVLGLAHMIMALNLPLRLRVLIPAVENSISGNAFRPQDILTSRKGLTVEINNTDAEGRLVRVWR